MIRETECYRRHLFSHLRVDEDGLRDVVERELVVLQPQDGEVGRLAQVVGDRLDPVLVQVQVGELENRAFTLLDS